MINPETIKKAAISFQLGSASPTKRAEEEKPKTGTSSVKGATVVAG